MGEPPEGEQVLPGLPGASGVVMCLALWIKMGKGKEVSLYYLSMIEQ